MKHEMTTALGGLEHTWQSSQSGTQARSSKHSCWNAHQALVNYGQNVLEEPVPQENEETTNNLLAVHSWSTCHCTVPMNWMKTTDAGGERTDTWAESWSQ
jgi:hypothetical protein